LSPLAVVLPWRRQETSEALSHHEEARTLGECGDEARTPSMRRPPWRDHAPGDDDRAPWGVPRGRTGSEVMNPARPAEPGRHQHVTGISQTCAWQWRRDSWIAVASGTGRVGCQVGESLAGDVHGHIVHSAIHTGVHNAVRLCPHHYPHYIVDTGRLRGQSLGIV